MSEQKVIFTVTIPRSHPKAQELAELARRLAWHIEDAESGVVTRKLAPPDADTQILNALRDVVDIDKIVRELQIDRKINPLDSPEVLAKILQGALPGVKMPFGVKTRYGNIADLIARGGRPDGTLEIQS